MIDILLIEDDDELRDALQDIVSLAGFSTIAAASGGAALSLLEQHYPKLVLTDIRMDNMDGFSVLREVQKRAPGTPVIMMTAHGDVDDAVRAMRQGAADYLQKPFGAKILTDKLSTYLTVRHHHDDEPVAVDAKSRQLMNLARQVAKSDVGVMISGESGCGKEVLARFIHQHSVRAKHPFIAINCAAIPEQMLEATLFGYEKGAFTGAYKSTPGKFEQAQDGTILLDEISEMSLSLQAKLLRVLQEKEVERIGSNKLVHLNIRVLATTNRDLHGEVLQGRFREDLYYRLNVFPLHMPALRERKGDIAMLASFLLQRHGGRLSSVVPTLSQASIDCLLDYSWPGNIRELENVMQRALVLASAGVIEPEHLMIDGDSSHQNDSPIKQKEYELIVQTLEQFDGHRQKVAEALGISARTLRYKMAKMRDAGFVL